MKKSRTGVISFIAVLLLIACVAYADTGVPAVPEIQGLTTSTGMNVQGTVTETDSGVWTLTNDPVVLYSYTPTIPMGLVIFNSQIAILQAQLQQAGGSLVIGSVLAPGPMGMSTVTQFNIPESMLNTPMAGPGTNPTWQQYITANAGLLSDPVVTQKGIHNGVLDPGQVQYTAGYNDQYSGVSGQQTFGKTVALSTGNKIADQSNFKANTNIQFIAMDAGRATRSEDILLDGAAQAQDSTNLILCPFANANPGIIPAFCNIEQAGSAFDTTLTSTVTSADTRFVGTDSTLPVVLNYNINAQGITLSDGTSSPMIGSVSAYLKVHVQEARNQSTINGLYFYGPVGPTGLYSFPDGSHPQKSEDLVYSESSSASGLISRFSKSMSYSSQASAVQAPVAFGPTIPTPP